MACAIDVTNWRFKWKCKLTFGAHLLSIQQFPTITNKLFIGGNTLACCLDASSGKLVQTCMIRVTHLQIWSTNLDASPLHAVVFLLIPNGALIIGSGGKVYSVNNENGKLNWTYNLNCMGRTVRDGEVTLSFCGSFNYIIAGCNGT